MNAPFAFSAEFWIVGLGGGARGARNGDGDGEGEASFAGEALADDERRAPGDECSSAFDGERRRERTPRIRTG